MGKKQAILSLELLYLNHGKLNLIRREGGF
jgi:hypothetical protein